MLRKLFLGILFGLSPLTALVAAGCTSNNADKPYALTGETTTPPGEQEAKERLRWTDDKGRYRADLRLAGRQPLRYVP
jgi:hypothetical protein